jgi:hypothetical protein
MNGEETKRKSIAHGRVRQDQKRSAFVVGVIGVALVLALAVFIPRPSEFQLLIFRVVLAAAIAGFATVLTGALKLTMHRPGIQATGAIGVFLLVFAINPPKLVTPSENPSIHSEYSLELKLLFPEEEPANPF